MSEPIISIQNLQKTFRVPVRDAGLAASAKSLFRPTYHEVEAVRQLSFSIQAGEVVGLLGPNGAGKTTTLKVLSGLLHPSSGEVRVAGFVPWERKPEYLRRISMVMGNKSQMLWDIPPLDTFQVLGEIYSLAKDEFQRRLDELVELLEMQELLTRPVRYLSLGERMKCELVAGLLHGPQVLFLDEPTLGLDVSMQTRLRSFLADYNRRSGVTILLTSHYMADVTALCARVILIHQGGLLYDGKLSGLARQLAPFKLIRLALREEYDEAAVLAGLPPSAQIIEKQEGSLTLRVEHGAAPAITAHLLQNLPVADLAVEDPPIEAVIDQIWQGNGKLPVPPPAERQEIQIPQEAAL